MGLFLLELVLVLVVVMGLSWAVGRGGLFSRSEDGVDDMEAGEEAEDGSCTGNCDARAPSMGPVGWAAASRCLFSLPSVSSMADMTPASMDGVCAVGVWWMGVAGEVPWNMVSKPGGRRTAVGVEIGAGAGVGVDVDVDVNPLCWLRLPLISPADGGGGSGSGSGGGGGGGAAAAGTVLDGDSPLPPAGSDGTDDAEGGGGFHPPSQDMVEMTSQGDDASQYLRFRGRRISRFSMRRASASSQRCQVGIHASTATRQRGLALSTGGSRCWRCSSRNFWRCLVTISTLRRTLCHEYGWPWSWVNSSVTVIHHLQRLLRWPKSAAWRLQMSNRDTSSRVVSRLPCRRLLFG